MRCMALSECGRDVLDSNFCLQETGHRGQPSTGLPSPMTSDMTSATFSVRSLLGSVKDESSGIDGSTNMDFMLTNFPQMDSGTHIGRPEMGTSPVYGSAHEYAGYVVDQSNNPGYFHPYADSAGFDCCNDAASSTEDQMTSSKKDVSPPHHHLQMLNPNVEYFDAMGQSRQHQQQAERMNHNEHSVPQNDYIYGAGVRTSAMLPPAPPPSGHLPYSSPTLHAFNGVYNDYNGYDVSQCVVQNKHTCLTSGGISEYGIEMQTTAALAVGGAILKFPYSSSTPSSEMPSLTSSAVPSFSNGFKPQTLQTRQKEAFTSTNIQTPSKNKGMIGWIAILKNV